MIGINKTQIVNSRLFADQDDTVTANNQIPWLIYQMTKKKRRFETKIL